MPELSQRQMLELVRSAVLAPSADNHHHVRFQPVAGGIRLWGDEYFRSCKEPHRRQFMVFACGAMIENLCVKAIEFGLICEQTPFPDPAHQNLISEITWRSSDDMVPDDLLSAIEKRHTNRKFFSGPMLSASELDALSTDAEMHQSVRVKWFNDPSERSALLSLIRVAETERFAQPSLHDELFSAIDWSAGWNKPCEEGLPPGALEVEPPLRPGFRVMAWWPLMRVLVALQAHRFLGLRAAYFPCRINAKLGVLAWNDSTAAAVIDAGRSFERLWLRATHLGLALQPLAASVALTLTPSSPGWARSQIQAKLREGWRHLIGTDTPMMVFRVGRADAPIVTAGRKAPETYLLNSSGSHPNGTDRSASRPS